MPPRRARITKTSRWNVSRFMANRRISSNRYATGRSRFQARAIYGRSQQRIGTRIGFPKTQVVRMRYHTTFLLTPNNGGAATHYTFRANSIFDPDFSSAGHQPYGHDQWNIFYSTYTVLGSKLTIKACKDEQNSTTSSNYLIGVLLHDDSGMPTTVIDNLIENGLSTPSRLGMANGVTTNVVNLTKKFSARKFFNLTSLKDNQDRIGAQFGSNPQASGDAYFHVYAAVVVAGGNDTTAIDCEATMEFLVLLSDPNALPGS